MDEHDPASRLALALDVPDLDVARRLIEQTREHIGVFKIGLELFTAVGPPAVEVVLNAGAKCFLDLKIHDMRRSYVTRLVRSGAQPDVVMTLAGHTSLSTTMTYYTATSKDDLRAAVAKMAAYAV